MYTAGHMPLLIKKRACLRALEGLPFMLIHAMEFKGPSVSLNAKNRPVLKQ